MILCKERNVLIVDDEPAIRNILARIISGKGHQTHTVPNGKAALAELDKKVYDLLIVDLKMFGLSGKKLYETLNKEQPDTANKIIFITGDTMTEETNDFLASSGRPFLPNPSTPAEIIELLKNDHVDLVLLDVMMPGKSGHDVLQEIKLRYPDTAVIMVTAIADVQTAIGLMRMGAYDYIIKPVELNILSLSLDRALEKRELLIENRDYQIHLEQRVEEQTKKIRQSFLNSTTSLAYALEAKDKYTHGHSERGTEIAVAGG